MGGDHELKVPFEDNVEGLTSTEATARLEKYGRNELPEKITPGWKIFLKGLWGPMAIALWVAIVIEFALQNWPDAAILLGIQLGNATIGWYETTKAGDAVAALKGALKPIATVFRDGKWQEIDTALVVPGDKVKLAAGSAVAADSTINAEPGKDYVPQVDIDEAALTGESLPVTMTPGTHMAKMGSNVVRGEVSGTVQYTGAETVFGKTALLLQSVEADLGNIHYVLMKIMYGLTGVSLILCVIVFIYLLAHEGESFKMTIEFTVVLLVVSIPIAIEIVVTTTLALGSKELSNKKVIVTRLAAIEMMAGVNMLCSDKTGTLTQNKMQIQQNCPTFLEGEDLKSTLVYSALAAKWREPPRDALDTMVLGSADLELCDTYTQLDYKPFDPRIKRTEATLTGPDGARFKVTKGAPNIVLDLCVNKAEIEDRLNTIITELGTRGIRCLAVAKTFETDNDWKMIGVLTFLDPPRPDTKATIAEARKYGVGVKMITGDHLLIAKEMGRMLDLGDAIETAENLPQFPASGDPKDIPNTLAEEYGEFIASLDGFAQVQPEHKYLIVETLRQGGFVVAMTGDGVNDAPALKRADVGIAVDGSTDAARAAADMVLTEPGLSVIVDAMLIARGVFQRMQSFLTYRIAATLQLVFFFFIAVFALSPSDYNAVVAGHEDETRFFHFPVLMFMLITLLNDGTLMAIGYDNVRPRKLPQKWNLPVMFSISAVLASVACLSSLLLLWMALDSVKDYSNSVFHAVGLPAQDYQHIVTMIYLKVSISDFLTLFSARTQSSPFFSYRPSLVLFVGAILSLTISTVVAAVWPDSSPDNIPCIGLSRLSDGQTESTAQRLMPLYIWLYCIFWWLVQDACKVGWCALMKKYDILSYTSNLEPSTPLRGISVGAGPSGKSRTFSEHNGETVPY
ncbi:Cation transporter/ATPase [Diplonema papillatum]|nr:Cation transporter/ATPase [Diplonema papillatum]